MEVRSEIKIHLTDHEGVLTFICYNFDISDLKKRIEEIGTKGYFKEENNKFECDHFMYYPPHRISKIEIKLK